MTLTTATIDTSKFAELQKMVDDPIKLQLIQLTLATAVPFAIDSLQRIGGPSDWHFGEASKFATRLGAEGDTLLFRVKGKTAEIMDRLCEVVAILAFCPGGIATFGLHFEVKPDCEACS